MSAIEWRKAYRLPQRGARRRLRGADAIQIPLFAPV